MDKQIETFKARFGKRIPDNILKLFFEDELYAYALNHKIGRELVSDAFFHTSDLIKKIAGLDKQAELETEKKRLDTCKTILSDICTNIKNCKDSNGELNIRDAFKKEEWEVFYNRCQTVERYNKEKRRLDNGRQFYTACKTIMASEVEAGMDAVIENGYEAIWRGETCPIFLYKTSFHKKIKDSWWKRVEAYSKNLKEIKEIIYKEN